MHECFGSAKAMRFWNTPVHSKRIETERAVRRFIDCTPSYYRFWSVADAKTNLCLGMVNYHDGHIRSKHVAIGYIVNPSRCREGIGAEAVLAMLQFCFGDLGMHRVQAFIHPDNAASRELVEKLGFRCEGRLRDNLRVGGEWRDDMLYALLATELLRPNLTSRLALLTSTQRSSHADGDRRSFLSPPQRNQPVRLIFLQLNAGARAGRSRSRFA